MKPLRKVSLGEFVPTFLTSQRVQAALTSGQITYGPISYTFEDEFANIHQCKHGIASSSGTSALAAALQALKQERGWSDGSRIIVPALTFVASVNAVIQNNLEPILVDIDDTFTIDCRGLALAVADPSVVGIMPVHLFGNPCNMEYILEIAAPHDIAIIEDCCEAFSAHIGDKRVGSFGDVGCFSTYAGHHICTGVGGMSTTNDSKLASTIRSIVNHGIDPSQIPSGGTYDPSVLARVFRFTSTGRSDRITELQAAIGIDQLTTWERRTEQRQKNAQCLRAILNGHYEIELMVENGNGCSYMVFPFKVRSHKNTHFIKALAKNGIQSHMAMPLTNQPCYTFNEDDFPVAKEMNDHGVYVGCHEYLDRDDMEYVGETMLEIIND